MARGSKRPAASVGPLLSAIVRPACPSSLLVSWWKLECAVVGNSAPVHYQHVGGETFDLDRIVRRRHDGGAVVAAAPAMDHFVIMLKLDAFYLAVGVGAFIALFERARWRDSLLRTGE